MTNTHLISWFLCLVSLACGGCRLVGTGQTASNASFPLDPKRVDYIIVGDDRSDVPPVVETNASGEITRLFPFHEFFRITDVQQIEKCTKELNGLRGRQDGRLTLSGILSMQIYVSRTQDVLAFATIICGYSTVLVSKDAVLRDGRAFMVNPTSREWASAPQPAYALEILRLMEERSPAEIEWREKECRAMDTNLRAYMGLQNKAE